MLLWLDKIQYPGFKCCKCKNLEYVYLMKYILLFLLVFSAFCVSAQNLAFNEPTFLQGGPTYSLNHYDSTGKIYGYHRRGYGGVIIGGSIVAAGLLAVALPPLF